MYVYELPYVQNENPLASYMLDKMKYSGDVVSGKWSADIDIWNGIKAKDVYKRQVCFIATSCVAIPIKETTKVFAELIIYVNN